MPCYCRFVRGRSQTPFGLIDMSQDWAVCVLGKDGWEPVSKLGSEFWFAVNQPASDA